MKKTITLVFLALLPLLLLMASITTLTRNQNWQ